MNTNEFYYQAYRIKDAQFDGVFFIGVHSTGIYCRPVCTAKMPKIENCRFFLCAEEAQQNGFRSCRRCRPELPPGFAQIDMPNFLATQAKKLIETHAISSDLTVAQLAARLGISNRHLHRLFTNKFGLSPSQFIQHHRLLLAKNLLSKTNLSVVAVCLKTGFKNARQFNTLFKQHYQLSPSHYRNRITNVN